IAYDVEHMPAADRVAGDHRDDGLGETTDLHLEVEHVEAADPVVVAVAVVATDALVAARAERVVAFAGEDDHAGRGVVARELESGPQLEEGAGTERVADLGPANRDLRDAVGGVVADVGEAVGGLRLPVGARSDRHAPSSVSGSKNSGSRCSYDFRVPMPLVGL